MRDVIWSDDALDDLEAAFLHTAQDNRHAASLVADRIEAAVALLARHPIGRPGRVKDTYEKPVLKTPYIIAYTVSDETLAILRVIHTSRDWPSGAWPLA